MYGNDHSPPSLKIYYHNIIIQRSLYLVIAKNQSRHNVIILHCLYLTQIISSLDERIYDREGDAGGEGYGYVYD